jgi:hypothetical protein
MSKLGTQLKSIGIYNILDLVMDKHPCIYRLTAESGLVPGWMLRVKGRSFAHAHWSDNGGMWFSDSSYHNWRAAVAAPLTKCKELFPDLEMVKGPWPNTYVPKCDLEAAKQRLKERL